MFFAVVIGLAAPHTPGTVERSFKKVAHGTYALTPYCKETHGHFTHYHAAVWKPWLVKFMAGLAPGVEGRAITETYVIAIPRHAAQLLCGRAIRGSPT